MRYFKPAALAATLFLSGCVAQEHFVKNNISYTQYEKDRASCETNAAQEVAVNRSPGAEVVVALLTGYYNEQDANAPARQRNYEACMISKGYQRVEFQPCKDLKDARENGVGPLTASERIQISANSCIANDTKGRVVFYKNAAAE